jgi:hypothetical protein
VTVTPIFGDNMRADRFGSALRKLLVLLDRERLDLLDWQGAAGSGHPPNCGGQRGQPAVVGAAG